MSSPKMKAFFSEHSSKVDGKGRLILPSKIKGSLPEDQQDTIWLSRGFEPCLVMYTQEEWEKIYKQIQLLNPFNKKERLFQRTFLRGSTDVDLDKTGRLLIPKGLLQYAQIEKDTLLVGLGNRVELWNPDLYEKHIIEDDSELSELAESYLNTKDPKEEKGVVFNIHTDGEQRNVKTKTE